LEPRDAFPYITEKDDSLFTIVESGGQLKASRADSVPRTMQLARNDPLISSQPECRQIYINLDTFVRSYLDNVARFHFFLYQHNEPRQNMLQRAGGVILSGLKKHFTQNSSSDNSTPNLTLVTASLQRLERNLTGHKSMIPTGDNLFRVPAPDAVTRATLAGTAVLEGSAADHEYGLTLENHTSVDLFPYVLFFDPRKYTIEVSPIYLTSSPFNH
jgi:hypothetical protein